MKTTEIIKKLQNSLRIHGDLDVCYKDLHEKGYADIREVVPVYPWKAYGIEDKAARVAFMGII